MNAFTIAASALLVGFLPLAIVALRTRPIDGVVALQLAGTVGTLVLLCLAEGLHRSFLYTLPVVSALMSWTGGLVFVRFLGRWL